MVNLVLFIKSFAVNGVTDDLQLGELLYGESCPIYQVICS